MSRLSLLLWVVLGCLGSWLALGLAPRAQLKAAPLPPPLARGEALYSALGCAGCHTQQLAPWDVAADADRGWGKRTTASHYAGAPPLGRLRLGPDLAAVGRRHPDAAWFAAYLRASHPGMPDYAFLFEPGRERDAAALVAYLRSREAGK